MGWFGAKGGAGTEQAGPVEPGRQSDGTDQAVFAAGCFWGVEDAFRRIDGVLDVVVGYTGGSTPAPTYEAVCSGQTGHAEAVLVTFDPHQVGYGDLVDAFWRMHDPTTPNRQGPDVGSQYRSGIFATDAEQLRIAQESAAAMQARFEDRIVTDITPAKTFWPAEAYHQGYTARTGRGGCHVANW